MKAKQAYNCRHGEQNIITKDVFCNRYLQFCKHIENCPPQQEEQQ